MTCQVINAYPLGFANIHLFLAKVRQRYVFTARGCTLGASEEPIVLAHVNHVG